MKGREREEVRGKREREREGERECEGERGREGVRGRERERGGALTITFCTPLTLVCCWALAYKALV